MGMSLREQLAAMPDLTVKSVQLRCAPDITIKVRRIQMKEREELLTRHKQADGSVAGAALTKDMLALGVQEPPLTPEEIGELPAIVVDELSEYVMDFNGWSAKGKAALADQFRPESGPPI